MQTSKNVPLLFIILAAIVLSSIGRSAHNDDQAFAVLYTEANFHGWSYRVLPGDDIRGFRRLDDGRWAFLDREIESIEIFGDMKVELWDSRNFNGESLSLRHSLADMTQIEVRRGHRRPEFVDWSNRAVSLVAKRSKNPSPPEQPPHRDRPHRSPRRGEIILFNDQDFEGEALVLEGRAQIPRLDEFLNRDGNWNDHISSIAMDEGFAITVFEHANFRGRSLRIEESTTNISQVLNQHGNYENWNDSISSLTIERVHSLDQAPPDKYKTPIATLFEHGSFAGGSLALFEGQQIPNLQEIDWNDRGSSLRIDPGYELVLFENAHFEGQSIRVSADQSNLNWTRNNQNRIERWNDKVSSLKVIRK